jgi:eukaryotic-like serine/threonine-protein kinase
MRQFCEGWSWRRSIITVANPKLATFSFKTAKVQVGGFFGGSKIVIKESTGQAKGFSEDLGGGVKLNMIEIPAGEFLMGSPSSEQDSQEEERPQHRVRVPKFYLGQTLVTQAQWQVLMGDNSAYFKGNGNLPVDSVSWSRAREFCQKLSQKSDGYVYRLPSEAEWDYACRAGTTTPFSFGETITPELVNYNGNYPYAQALNGEYREKTTNVGSFPANSFGLYDMHGNLREWCLDKWVGSYDGAPADGSAREDGGSPDRLWNLRGYWFDGAGDRLLRSGSWLDGARYCRSGYRYCGELSLNVVGLRVVAVRASTPSRQSS